LGYAEEAEAGLIVMSSHGRTGLGRWVFGSVADRVLRASEIPVWIVRADRPPEHESV
jgi:nucleotide-binding universal stress UspA family protein